MPTRQSIRALRRSITGAQRTQFSKQAAAHVYQSALWHRAHHIAVFLSLPEEIDTQPLIHALWQAGKALYLPYVRERGKALSWLAYTADSVLHPDTLGIPAPAFDEKALCPLSTLDLVIMPLVAWDPVGNRLGMGGGYYDRTLAAQSALPRLGLAYECQGVAQLSAQPWDLPLHYLATERQFYTFSL